MVTTFVIELYKKLLLAKQRIIACFLLFSILQLRLSFKNIKS